MSDIKTILDKGISKIFGDSGLSTSINIYSYTFDSGTYDDVTTKTLTGSNTISGLMFPIKGSQGSSEAMLLNEGKLLMNDSVLYTGSVNVSGNILIDIGSEIYSVIPDGIHSWGVNGSTVYNKFYIRVSNTGSLF